MIVLAIGLLLMVVLSFFDESIIFGRVVGGGYAETLLMHLFAFVISYVVSSYWFSPDMDVRADDNRPGKHSFPGGPFFKLLKAVRSAAPWTSFLTDTARLILTPLHLVLNRSWRILWRPLAMLVTHRGLLHWPLIGSQVKILYLVTIYWVLATTVEFTTGQNLPIAGGGLIRMISDLYATIFENSYLSIAWVALMTADICHSAVDLWDSLKEGKSFVPRGAPRGMIVHVAKKLLGR